MKILVFALLLMATAGLALGGPVSFGFRAGADMANQVYSNTDPYAPTNGDVIFGFTGGLFTEMKISDVFSIQPEVEYARKGGQYKSNILVTGPGLSAPGTVVGTFTHTFDYLEIPVLAKVHTPFSSHLEGNLSAGPEIGIPLAANNQISTSLGTINQTYGVQEVDWGVLLGVGLELDGFLVDLRYDHGLTSGGYNSVLSFQAGYRIL